MDIKIYFILIGIIREILIIYQNEIDSIPDRQSPINNTHLNVMVKISYSEIF